MSGIKVLIQKTTQGCVVATLCEQKMIALGLFICAELDYIGWHCRRIQVPRISGEPENQRTQCERSPRSPGNQSIAKNVVSSPVLWTGGRKVQV